MCQLIFTILSSLQVSKVSNYLPFIFNFLQGAASSPKRRDRPEKKKAAVTLPPAGGTILSIAKQTQSEEAKKVNIEITVVNICYF